MKHQVIAAAGLAAVIAFCGYMIAQLDTNRPGRATGSTASITGSR